MKEAEKTLLGNKSWYIKLRLGALWHSSIRWLLEIPLGLGKPEGEMWRHGKAIACGKIIGKGMILSREGIIIIRNHMAEDHIISVDKSEKLGLEFLR